MFNPLVDSFSDLTDTEVESKIVELQRKYFQTTNPGLQQQIATILEMYKEEARARRAREYQRQIDNNGEEGLDNLINIS
jgi:tryptophanase